MTLVQKMMHISKQMTLILLTCIICTSEVLVLMVFHDYILVELMLSGFDK